MLTCPSCAHPNNEAAKFCEECGTKLEATPVREERKVITALFCDVVGSTALGESMDHEDVARLLERYQSICRARIESHGGVVEKFIGDAVVGVFGVPTAHEDDPERAVRAALRICSDVDHSDLPIQVRIGVNTGEVLVRLGVDTRSGVGFATGDTMNTTARLEAAAPVMGVAVGERTFAATHAIVAYEVLRPIQAKGKAEPLAAWRALEPISRVHDERERTPFVGRELEFTMLTQLFERARTRPATEFATIVADPGLGKSRLVRELSGFVDQVPEVVRWRIGRCLPYGEGIGFWALGEIVKAEAGILESDDQDTLRSKLERAVTEPDPQTRSWVVDRLAPLVGLETDTAAPDQQEAFTAWRRFLESLATQDPTVVVIEDLHWADAGFVAFLEHLADRTAGLPLLVVVTARPEVEERHPSWPPGRRSTVLSLPPLGDADVEALVRTALPEAPEELTAIVLERAGGSPLYAEQLAVMLTEHAMPISRAVDEALIPQSVQALIAARIDALPDEPKRVLMEASVVGKTFWNGAVAFLGEHAGLESTLAELVRRDFCRPAQPSSIEGDREFSFWHALVRDVAYAELTKAERARLHTSVATWIAERTGEAMGEEAEIIVHHLDAALELAPSAPNLETAPVQRLLADALLAAGEAALRTEVSKAVRYLERRLSEGSADDAAGDLKTKLLLARAHVAAGDPGAARAPLEEVFERLIALDDIETAVLAASELDGVYQLVGDIQASAPMMEELRRRVGSEPSRALAELIAIEVGTWVGWKGAEDGLRRTRTAIEMAEGLGATPPPMAHAIHGICMVTLGDRSGETEVDFAVDELLRQGRTSDAISLRYNLAFALAEESPLDGLQRMDALIELTGRLGADSEVWITRAGRGHVLRALGRFDEVIGEAETILARTRGSSGVLARTFALLNLAWIEIYRGPPAVDLTELEELVRGTVPMSLWEVGAAAHARGDDESARALIVEASDIVRESIPAVANACLEVGLTDLAEELLGREVRDTRSDRAERAIAEGALARGRGDATSSVERYNEAAHAFEALGMIVGEARALQGLGECLLQIGEADEGLTRLRMAERRWKGLKATSKVAEVQELLASESP
jgi:class 3 adenylate cyclase/tetratricopeptide (TPR) repeat protein